jgi:23S rRNA pseudouridine1911/1915/1917 synthase
VPDPPFEILYEDNHCLAILKPAGRLSTHYAGTEATMDLEVKDYLRARYGKPGNVFLGIVHRLDRPVSGVLLFARTSKAAARLARQFRDGTIEKVYWAVIEGIWPVLVGSLVDWLRKDERTGRVEVVEARTPGSRQAMLHYQRRAVHDNLTWMELRPQTGRRHQLRVQMAHRLQPIYGDAKYGSVHVFDSAIALHARALTFLHPVRYEPITLTAEVPAMWRGRFAYLFREAQP